MNITEVFLNFARLGAAWVMWLLVGLSVLSVGVMIERAIFFYKRRIDIADLAREVKRAIRDDDARALEKSYRRCAALPAQVALVGVAERAQGIDVVSEAMNSAKTRGRSDLEQNLTILGTLGNNAPFIGLFGTILGIIGAFDKLSQNADRGANLVMGEIADALTATGIGLIVAIPAVVAFNYFSRRVRASVTATDEIAHAVLAEMHRGGEGGATADRATADGATAEDEEEVA